MWINLFTISLIRLFSMRYTHFFFNQSRNKLFRCPPRSAQLLLYDARIDLGGILLK